MDDSVGIIPIPAEGRGRKRKRDVSSWKRENTKENR